MRFALDEDVAHPLAGRLRADDYDADSAKELGRLGLTDVQVLVQAAESAQTVITRNSKHFRSLHEAWVDWRRRWSAEVLHQTGIEIILSGHAGILIVPSLPVSDLAQIIEPFADGNVSIDDALFAWTASRGWHEIRF